MEAERITLNQRERDRLRVLNEIRQKHITQTEAAQRLKISDRHIRRLLVAVAFRGDRAVVHGLRGRASNRRLATRLEEILSVRVARQVAEDHTVSWDGTRWGVPREEVCAGLRGAQVEIERRLDGSHWLRFRGRYLRLAHCSAPRRPSANPSGLRPTGLAEPISKPKTKIKSKYHVPPNHPWKRKPWKRTFLLGRKPAISTLR